MTLKKFALRGMIVLAAVIALCVLFSGTFRSLTTAKVTKADVRNGKLETATVLMGKVVFPEEEEMNIQVPEELSLTVRRLYVTPGQQISKGQRMIAAEVTDGNKKLLELQAQYVKVRDTLDNWDRKHGDIRLTRNEEAWMNAYTAARTAEDQELELRHALMANLELSNTNDLNETTVKKAAKAAKDAGNKKAAQAILEEYNNWLTAKNAMTDAQKKLKSLDRYAVEDTVWTTLQEKNATIKEKAEIEDKMMAIRQLQKQVALLRRTLREESHVLPDKEAGQIRIIPWSGQTKAGREEIYAVLDQLLTQGPADGTPAVEAEESVQGVTPEPAAE